MAVVENCLLSFFVPWGDQPNQLGLIREQEVEWLGPLTYTVAPEGELYVADTVHQQVKRWQADGTYAGIVIDHIRPRAMSVDSRGALLLLSDHSIQTFSRTGQLLSEVKVPAQVPLVEGYGQDVWEEDGDICVNDPEENVFCFTPSQSMPTTASKVTMGRRAHGKVRVLVHGGRARVQAFVVSDSHGWNTSQLLRSPLGSLLFDPASLRREDPRSAVLGALLFRGFWEKQKSYLFEMEEVAGGNVRLFLVTMDKAKLSRRVEIPNSYFTTVYKKIEPTRDGTVWQMLTTPSGVRFLQWQVAP